MVSIKIIQNRYIDSVSLMAFSTQANDIEGVEQAIIAMGTEMNKEVMRNVGLLTNESEHAEASDLIIAVVVKDSFEEKSVLEEVENLLNKKKTIEKSDDKRIYRTVASAKENNEEANFVIISVNGHYAAREAKEALNAGLNVMMFSDNVPVEDEVRLKQLAHEKGLLMMGPDCGTAIINHTALGFANEVRPGNIGIIGASGTGSQEIAVRIHEFGGGVSQLIGTGGRDLSLEVGGTMMLDGLDLLADDSQTKVIVLISKPPAKEVEEAILTKVQAIPKPVVIWFVGSEEEKQLGNVYIETMSKNAALKALTLAGVDISDKDLHPLNLDLIEEVKAKFLPEQRYIRGLFSGGTLCAEAYYQAKGELAPIYCNVAKDADIPNEKNIEGHVYIDFGDDEYTDGKPHPMIDPETRTKWFIEEAKNPEVAVILLDFVIGYGANQNPVGSMIEEIKTAISNAKAQGRHLEIIGYVLGTELDEQGLAAQIKLLTDAGATYASSNQNAGLLAREMVKRGVSQ